MSATDRRAAAAAIFTDPRNGRVPRTLVNRIWQKLMGRGIVENVDEMDGEPWSPELLDWLASDFVERGYDIKALIATIMNSRTYQLPAVPGKAEAAGEVCVSRAGVATDDRGAVRRRHCVDYRRVARSIAGGESAGRGQGSPVGNFRRPFRRRGDHSRRPGAVPARQADLRELRRLVVYSPVEGVALLPSPPPPTTIPIAPANYVREWRIAGSALDRALGRPIRDQVYSTRDTQATTIQALELVNGGTLTHWLWRGARRMLGELPPEPVSLLSRQMNNIGRAPPPVETPGTPAVS